LIGVNHIDDVGHVAAPVRCSKAKVRKAAPPRNRPMILGAGLISILYYLGLRREELVNAKKVVFYGQEKNRVPGHPRARPF